MAPLQSRGEMPVYVAFGDVTLGFSRTHFPGEGFKVGDTPVQTLASQHRELYLGHVQARAVLWSVVDLQPLAQASDSAGSNTS